MDASKPSPNLLAPLEGAAPPAPAWFQAALETPAETGALERAGAEIVWKAWGARGDPAFVLIHGGTAHKGWWDAIGPHLAKAGRRVIAPDLAGMGASGWRDVYALSDHAADVRAVAEAAGGFEAGPPIYAGHSFGGFVTLQSLVDYGEALGGALVIDSPVRAPDTPRGEPPRRQGGRVYPDVPAALSRFRLVPEQQSDKLWLVDHIARGSLKAVEGGWTWCFDPDIWRKLTFKRIPAHEIPRHETCPLVFARGVESVLMQGEVWDYMRSVFPGAPFLTVPAAQHHVILDQPEAVAVMLETLDQTLMRR